MISAKARLRRLRFQFIPDPQRPGPCELIPFLRDLWDLGALHSFAKDFGQRQVEWGNCHDVSASLAADLLFWGLADGWRYVSADESPGWGHTWLEYDGWAVDGSERSLLGRVLILPGRNYRNRLTREGWTWTWDHSLEEILAMPDDEGAGVSPTVWVS